MQLRAPTTYHLDLYRYWLAKRAGRAMPARRDINPADIPALLSYLGLVDKVDGEFRWRLVGAALAEEFGRDLTGSFIGSLNDALAPGEGAALQSIFARVFKTAHPVFATCVYKTKRGSIHTVSQLILPLSDDGTTVNMNVCTRIERFNFDVAAEIELNGLPVKVRNVVDVDDAEGLEELFRDWEQRSDGQRPRAEGIAQRA
jgi:hypothetical protein